MPYFRWRMLRDIIQCLTSCDDLWIVYVAVNGIISFFFMAEEYSTVYVDHIFIHPSVDGHLGCLHVLANWVQCCFEYQGRWSSYKVFCFYF